MNYPYLVNIIYTKNTNTMDSIKYFDPFHMIDTNELSIEYLYTLDNHKITIKSNSLFIINEKLVSFKQKLFQNNCCIKKIEWDCSIKQKNAAIYITKWLIKNYYSPYTIVGKKRLTREYNKLMNEIV